MRKSELFAHILECIVAETELSQEQILSANKNAEVVDARYIMVYLLDRSGLYHREIARFSGISRQAVGRMISHFDTRRYRGGKIFEILLNRICKRLEIN